MSREINFSREKREELIKSIKNYFLNERDEELGDLAASLLLDFVVREIAPELYNRGIEDAYSFMKDKTEDILSLEIVKR